MNKRRRKNGLLVIFFTYAGLFVICPLLYVFVLSFLSRNEIGTVVFRFTLENYERISNPLYLGIFLDSLAIAALTSVITLIIGYPFAYFMTRLSPSKKILSMLLLMIPFWTSSLLRTYGWMIILAKRGIINTVIQFIFPDASPLSLIYNYGAVLMGTVYMLLPFMILSVYNSVDKLDRSLLEASYDLGASKMATFFKITLPMTAAGIVGGITLVFIPAVGLFFISDLLGGAKTMLLGNLIRNQLQSARNAPFGAAVSVVMTAVVMIFIFSYRRLSGKLSRGGEEWSLF